MMEETQAYSQEPLPSFRSSATDAFKAIIETPNWVGNLLWLTIAGVASSILVGQIAAFGYGVELLRRRAGRPEMPNHDVDSDRLGDYLSQGIWPFLVALVIQFGTSMVLALPFGLRFVVGLLAMGDIVGLGAVVLAPIVIVASLLASILTVPFVLRAMICQDFVKAFDLGWAIHFVKLMVGEMILSGIIFFVLAWLLNLAGALACCVGVFVTSGWVLGATMHLGAQLYEVYLSRGGEPVPEPTLNS